MAKLAIEVDDLVKDFPMGIRGWKLRAVDHVSFKVPENAVFGLLGPNGSGKSTAMKILLGLIRPTSGNTHIYGQNVQHIATRAEVGFLPEAPYFYRFLCGREWVRLCGRLSGLSAKEASRRTDEVLELVDMGEAALRRIGTYSKGMLQRIGLAQALVHEPRLLILDEPTAGVDPIGTAALIDIIRELKKRNKTVLLCSHLLSQVEDVCDEVAIMSRGKLKVTGEVGSLLSRDDEHLLRLKGLSQEKQQALLAWLEREGVEVKASGASRRTLDELFLEQVKEDKA